MSNIVELINPFLPLMSSFLFLVPYYLSLFKERYNITISTVICLLTSVLCHGFGLPFLRKLDIITVNIIGIYFTINSILHLPNLYHIYVVFLSLLSGFLYISSICHISWVHVFANIGICFYILAPINIDLLSSMISLIIL
jgi:hypothetical protein